MVNIVLHFGIGLLIASAAGLTGKRRWLIGFMAIIPDLDVVFAFPYFLNWFGNLDYSVFRITYFIFGHREFSHTPLFILVIAIVVLLVTRKRFLSLVVLGSMFSHITLDLATLWKLRPLYPLTLEPVTIGSMVYIEPVVSVVGYGALLLVLFEELIGWHRFRNKIVSLTREKGSLTKRMVSDLIRTHRTFKSRKKSIFLTLIVIFVIWFILMVVAKGLLLQHISDEENANISYEDTYSTEFGTYVSAYSYNSTHFKVIESTFWGGIERTAFVAKVQYDTPAPNGTLYLQRAKELYRGSAIQELDYPTYHIEETNSSVSVSMTDARIALIGDWAYFEVHYRFVFNKTDGSFIAYKIENDMSESRVPNNRFE